LWKVSGKLTMLDCAVAEGVYAIKRLNANRIMARATTFRLIQPTPSVNLTA
jgi:hypothetical protein